MNKYNVGDQILLHSADYVRANFDTNIRNSYVFDMNNGNGCAVVPDRMLAYFGNEAVITEANESYYYLDIDEGKFAWTDAMISHVVYHSLLLPEFKIGEYVRIKSIDFYLNLKKDEKHLAKDPNGKSCTLMGLEESDFCGCKFRVRAISTCFEGCEQCPFTQYFYRLDNGSIMFSAASWYLDKV